MMHAWEYLSMDNHPNVRRLEVPGGWLYQVSSTERPPHLMGAGVATSGYGQAPPTPYAWFAPVFVQRGSVADAVIDAIITNIAYTHDGSELWKHLKQDPETFRKAVRRALGYTTP